MAEALTPEHSSSPTDESDSDSSDWDSRSRSSSVSSVESSAMQHTFLNRQSSYSESDTSLDMSYLSVDRHACDSHLTQFSPTITTINLTGNRLRDFPQQLLLFSALQMLDMSHNQLTSISPAICQLRELRALICADNRLDDHSLPKEFGQTFATSLRVLSLGGNLFRSIPSVIFELSALKSLYLGANAIEEVPRDICRLLSLRILYIGGNRLQTLPEEVGRLESLESLSLCENRLRSLPSSIAQLKSLRSLALHRNQLTTLPPEIVKLRGLVELSLRNNPLVMRFVREMTYGPPPTLLELAARTMKVNKVQYNSDELPQYLANYLDSAHRCVNPKCKGVYFDARVEHIKFVDFCGSYRLPLLEYLCSPRCSDRTPAVNRENSSEDDIDDSEQLIDEFKLKRVLLG